MAARLALERSAELAPEQPLASFTLGHLAESEGQADAAERAGYSQFADNLRRAAELTAISNAEVLEIYNALRPGRSTYEELLALAQHLEDEHAAPRTAGLVREAAAAYRERGIVKTVGP